MNDWFLVVQQIAYIFYLKGATFNKLWRNLLSELLSLVIYYFETNIQTKK